MTETQFWEDDCPLLQEIVGKEWESYRTNLWANDAIEYHTDNSKVMDMPAKLYLEREAIIQKVENFYGKTIEAALGKPLDDNSNEFAGNMGTRLNISLGLPIIGGTEAPYLLLFTSIDGAEPEEIIRCCADVIQARDFLAKKGYEIEYEQNEGNLDHTINPKIDSVAELKTFLGDLKQLYDLFEGGK